MALTSPAERSAGRDWLWPIAPAAEPDMAEQLAQAHDARRRGRDVLIPEVPSDEAAHEAKREQVIAELEHQRCAIDELICRLESANHEGEQDAQLDDLRTQQRWLDAAISLAQLGPAQLVASMAGSVSQIAGSVASSVSSIASSSMVQAGALMAEVTASAIERMSIGDMARNFTPAHFAQMSDQQLAAVFRRVDRAIDDADDFGRNADAFLEEQGDLGEEYRREREELEREKEEARRNDDRLAYLRALRRESELRERELRERGLDAQAEAERQNRQRIEDAARVAARAELANEAREKGMSPAEAERYIRENEEGRVGEVMSDTAERSDGRSEVAADTSPTQLANVKWYTNLETRSPEAETVDEVEEQRSDELFATAAADAFAGFGNAEKTVAEVAPLPVDPTLARAAEQFRESGQATGGATPDTDQPEGDEPPQPKAVATATPKSTEKSPAQGPG